MIYVNAAADAPAPEWIAALRDGGRLIFPWRYGEEGEVAMIVRRTARVVSSLLSVVVRFIGPARRAAASSPPTWSRMPSSPHSPARHARGALAPDETCAADFRMELVFDARAGASGGVAC